METGIIIQDNNKGGVLMLSLIKSKIHNIRGYNVILDRDLAIMYDVTTSNLNKAVKRNIGRFPEDFMFQLSYNEFDLIFQNGTSNWGGTRKLPYAFTEHGVAMLAGLLNSLKAIDANIQIVRTFVMLRQYALGYSELNKKLEDFMSKSDMQFRDINELLKTLLEHKKELEKPSNPIGFVKPNLK
jgi:hypothetical protein